jgi:DNA-binding protein H-NS
MAEENVAMKYMKDGITILVFLASVAGIYIKLSEQVVRLELKVTILEERTKELKASNDKIIEKLATIQTVHNEITR